MDQLTRKAQETVLRSLTTGLNDICLGYKEKYQIPHHVIAGVLVDLAKCFIHEEFVPRVDLKDQPLWHTE